MPFLIKQENNNFLPFLFLNDYFYYFLNLWQWKRRKRQQQLSPIIFNYFSSFSSLISSISQSPSILIFSHFYSFYFTLILLILFNISFTLSNPIHPKISKNSNIPTIELSQQQNYLLSIDNINKLFQRTAIFAVLKAKAKATKNQVPQIEQILFSQCLAEYKPKQLTPVNYAKCLVKLIKAKKRFKEEKREEENLKKVISPKQKRASRFRHFFTLWRKRKGSKFTKLKKLKLRNKRAILKETTKTLFVNKRDEQLPKNVQNLRILERYGRTLKHCRRFITAMNERNAKFLSKLMPNVRLSPNIENIPSNMDGLQTQIEQFTNQLVTNSERITTKNNQKISLLSPRLFSLYPKKKKRKLKASSKIENFVNNLNENISQLLSPEIFALYNQSINLISLEAIGQNEQIEWLDLLMNITGMSRMLDSLVNQLNPEMAQLETKLYPTILQIEAKEREWNNLKASLENKQIEMINKLGYAHLYDWQQNIIKINKGNEFKIGQSLKTLEGAESALEEKIEAIANLKEGEIYETSSLNDDNIPPFRQVENSLIDNRKRKRRKRQDAGLAPDTEIGVHPIPRILALEPFAFDTRLGGVVLEGLFLSPHAFYREIISPEVLTIRALSPVAFYATILSPMAVFARILSPEVFKAQILTPQVLDTYTLSPEAFMAEVLSPVAAEARVLSPRALFVQILGPAAGAIHVGSPDFFGILVLSPHFLSPRIYSKEHYLIEILSPHILGGEHSSESEEDEHEHLGGAVRFVGWPDHEKKGKGGHKHNEKGEEGEHQHNEKGEEGEHQHNDEGEQHSERTEEHSEGEGQHSEGEGHHSEGTGEHSEGTDKQIGAAESSGQNRGEHTGSSL